MVIFLILLTEMLSFRVKSNSILGDESNEVMEFILSSLSLIWVDITAETGLEMLTKMLLLLHIMHPLSNHLKTC